MNDSVTNASENSLSRETVGDVPGCFCDKYGQDKLSCTIEEMVHSPDAKYNLFSLTKQLEDGRVLIGDRNALWISKGEVRIVFDIKVKTPKRAIFAACF